MGGTLVTTDIRQSCVMSNARSVHNDYTVSKCSSYILLGGGGPCNKIIYEEYCYSQPPQNRPIIP